MTDITTIQIRRDTSANWSSFNPVLSIGEIALDTTLNKLKVGDGVSDWDTLGYIGKKKPDLGNTPNSNPVHGDMWIDTRECPPVIRIYSDPNVCDEGETGWVQS